MHEGRVVNHGSLLGTELLKKGLTIILSKSADSCSWAFFVREAMYPTLLKRMSKQLRSKPTPPEYFFWLRHLQYTQAGSLKRPFYIPLAPFDSALETVFIREDVRSLNTLYAGPFFF